MQTPIRPGRIFGQQVEYWEHTDVPFGWSREDLRGYAERGDWVLLFNPIVLATPARRRTTPRDVSDPTRSSMCGFAL